MAEVLALGGQVARTVDSVPPAGTSTEQRAAEPPASLALKAAPEGLADSLGGPGDAQIRVLPATTPDRDDVAFSVQLKAAATPPASAPRESPVKAAAEGSGSRLISAPETQRDLAVAEPAAASGKRPPQPGWPEPAPARAARERHTETPAEPAGTPSPAPTGKSAPYAEPDAAGRTEAGPGRGDTATPKPGRLQDAMKSDAGPEAAKAAPLREMKFEVTGGERRVEVRLSERAGEVKMTVRTADAPLASSLRENLPALSARLAETGLRSETWRPAASSTDDWRHNAESPAGGASQDANAQPREQGREAQDGAAQRRHKSPQEPAPLKEKGRDFAWLMSSLR